MMGAAWRLSAIWEYVTGKKAKATKESVANTHMHHSYETNRLEKTLLGHGMDWKYQPINETIQEVSKAFLEQQGVR
tara:strand:+ start:32 stop:259 length:228 start_codon:yes stop_codon:yes gene_type:complete